MSTIRKLFAVSTVAAAAALTACGGGDTITEVITATENATVAITPTTAAAAAAVVTGLGTAEFPIATALTFTKGTAATDGSAPAGSTLTLAPSTTTGEIAKFTISSSASDGVDGDVTPGSCVFTARAVRGTFGGFWTIGRTYVMPICTIVLPTINVPAGQPRTLTPILRLAPTPTSPVTSLTTTKTITINISNTGSVLVNNTPVTTTKVVSSTGGTGT